MPTTIDVRSPQGNVFNILEIAKRYQVQLSETDLRSEELEKVLKGFGDMQYDEILDQLEKTGLFTFINRK